jgi:D-alanyl-D-alanine carboxypeptidase
MTATVASELIYLGRSVVIDAAMTRDAIQSYPLKTGERVQAFDLLYPLLMESSNGSARALAAFMGERYFLSQMKAKSMTLSMKDTDFEDPAGVGDGNKSSLRDLAKLSKYILEKRRFIFEVGKGEDFRFFGINTLSGIKNYNEFAGEENLVGMKNGGTEAAGQTILTIWKMKDRRGDPRNIFIGVLGSENRVRDVEATRAWLKAVFGLE